VKHLPDFTRSQDGITVAVTSCNRHDLLQRTLDSLAKHADLPIAETIIMEDSPSAKPAWLDEFSGLGKITWLTNGKRQGQVISIDRLYDHVRTSYVFHCEDDWLFGRSGFLKSSLEILQNHAEILQVWLRREDCTHPREKLAEYPFETITLDWREGWSGFSWNPGLRRMADYQRIGSYGRMVGYHAWGLSPEFRLNKVYRDLGYRSAVLAEQCVQHIGAARGKATEQPTPFPKCLIAIPTCQNYDYGTAGRRKSKVPRVTGGRIKAQRETWLRDIKPFSASLSYRFFYGAPVRSDGHPDEVFLDVPDDYEHLSRKVQAICKYALDRGYDYLYKCDDDTAVFVDRLMRSGFENCDQMGFSDCRHKRRGCSCYIRGGPGYWLSRRAMQLVVDAPACNLAEDLWVGKVLRESALPGVIDVKRLGHPGYLPGETPPYVSPPLPEGTVTAHACTPEMMRAIFGVK
jgi:hypothetical protein